MGTEVTRATGTLLDNFGQKLDRAVAKRLRTPHPERAVFSLM